MDAHQLSPAGEACHEKRSNAHSIQPGLRICILCSPVYGCTSMEPQTINIVSVHTRTHTHTNAAHKVKVISVTAASVCVQARQTANKRPISRAIHLWRCRAGWFKWVLVAAEGKVGVRWLYTENSVKKKKDTNGILWEFPSTVTNELNVKQGRGQTYILLF